MLTAIAIANVAIALLCFVLTGHVARYNRQVIQLTRDLNRWTVLLEHAFTARRTDLRQWQLTHLQWQLQQRRLLQTAKFLQLIWRMRKRWAL